MLPVMALGSDKREDYFSSLEFYLPHSRSLYLLEASSFGLPRSFHGYSLHLTDGCMLMAMARSNEHDSGFIPGYVADLSRYRNVDKIISDPIRWHPLPRLEMRFVLIGSLLVSL